MVEFIQNNFKISDQVLIKGTIKKKTYTGPGGKRVFAHHIVAENAVKQSHQRDEAESSETNEFF